jgi:hypothetical protein
LLKEWIEQRKLADPEAVVFPFDLGATLASVLGSSTCA